MSLPDIPTLTYNYEQQINKKVDEECMIAQLNNLKTLFDAKFQEDVVNINYEKSMNYHDFRKRVEDEVKSFIKNN